jgi:hydroxymethylbilane synthase
VEVVPIRGNVETRLRKAEGDEADGAVLAAAGLARLQMESRVADYLSPQRFVPPPGQGALAVEVRNDDQRMIEILKCIEHPATRFEVTAERAFLETLGGGCSLPVGAYARTMGHELLMTVFLSNPEASRVFTAKVDGLKHDPRQLAGDAYLAVAERGGADLLEGARQPQGPPATENL